MLQTIQYQTLNSEAKEYLSRVRQMQGRGAPGIYLPMSYNRPLWAFIFGLMIIPFTLIFSYSVPKSPMATAALQTGGLLLGGWLILYAFRRWLASSNHFCGKFMYFDPDHVFIGEGENMRFAYLQDNPEVEPVGQSSVRFATEEGSFVVAAPNTFSARLVADYYQALSWVRSRKEGRWVDLELPEAGAVAKYLATMDEEPASVADTDLELDSMPEDVRSTGKGSSGIGMILAILVVGAGMFGFFTITNEPLQDEMAFSDAKSNGAQGLRDYLLNERNTRHRDEAKEMLAKLYDAPITTVENTATDPVLKRGMVELLNTLRGPETPAVSIRIRSLQGELANLADDKTHNRFADGIGSALGGTKKDLIVMVRAPSEDDKKAMIDIEYTKTNAGILNWKVSIYLKPDDASPVATTKGSSVVVENPLLQLPQINIPGVTTPQPVTLDAAGEALYRDILTRMIGSAPAAPLPPADDNDF